MVLDLDTVRMTICKSSEQESWAYYSIHNSAISSVVTPIQQVSSNRSIFHWGNTLSRLTWCMTVSFHPNLVPLILSSSLMASACSLCSLTKHMPIASATCLAKKAGEQTTPPTVAWRWSILSNAPSQGDYHGELRLTTWWTNLPVMIHIVGEKKLLVTASFVFTC